MFTHVEGSRGGAGIVQLDPEPCPTYCGGLLRGSLRLLKQPPLVVNPTLQPWGCKLLRSVVGLHDRTIREVPVAD